MNARKEYLLGVLERYLDRRSVPQHIAGNVQARKDEIAALARALVRAAPDSGYQEWWPALEDAIDSIMRTRIWPTVNEIRASAKLVQKNGTFSGREVVVEFNPASINLKRLRSGAAVGEQWLFGANCVQLIQAGATEDDFASYRTALFFSEKDLVGEDVARKRECVRRDRHDEARLNAGMSTFFDAPQIRNAEAT